MQLPSDLVALCRKIVVTIHIYSVAYHPRVPCTCMIICLFLVVNTRCLCLPAYGCVHCMLATQHLGLSEVHIILQLHAEIACVIIYVTVAVAMAFYVLQWVCVLACISLTCRVRFLLISVQGEYPPSVSHSTHPVHTD